MIGWAMFISLVILILASMQDVLADIGNSFGYPESHTNWTLIKMILIVGWIILLLYKFKIISINL